MLFLIFNLWGSVWQKYGMSSIFNKSTRVAVCVEKLLTLESSGLLKAEFSQRFVFGDSRL